MPTLQLGTKWHIVLTLDSSFDEEETMVKLWFLIVHLENEYGILKSTVIYGHD